jgi:hypothetical protein
MEAETSPGFREQGKGKGGEVTSEVSMTLHHHLSSSFHNELRSYKRGSHQKQTVV